MAKYRITAPSGEKFDITAPEGASQEQVMSYAQQQFSAKPKASEMPELPRSYTAGEAALEGAKNLIPSTIKFGVDTASTLLHPVDTVTNVARLAEGGLANLSEAIPGKATPVQNRYTQALQPSEEYKQSLDKSKGIASAVGKQYADRYGSMEGFKRAVAEDPASILGDISTLLTGGASLAPKAGKLAGALRTAGDLTNPLYAAEKIVTIPTGLAGNVTKGTIGTTTGVGNEPINQAIKAGEQSVLNAGNKASEAFTKNMRGAPDVQSAVDIARNGLNKIREAKNAEYRSGMLDVSKDKSILSFDDVENALKDSLHEYAVTDYGKITNQKTFDKLNEIKNAINEHKTKYDPAQAHTPLGFDDLKQEIGGILESIPYEEKTARAAVNKVYNSVKQTIVDQAPTYSDVMKNYSESSDLIDEITKSLLSKDKAKTDASLRKLQSVMRNNVQTNYGERARLAEELVNKGGADTLMPTLAGQALNTLKPRGLGGQLETYGGLGYVLTHPAALGTALMAAPFAMPRVMGEAAYAYGKGKGAIKKAGEKVPFTKEQARKAAMLLQQTQPNQEEQ